MEQRRIGEDTVEVGRGKLQREKILLPDFAAAVLARHGGERRRTLEADRLVAQRAKRRQVASRAAAEIEDAQRRRTAYVSQQRVDVLLHVVVASAGPELGRALAVVRERLRANESQIL